MFWEMEKVLHACQLFTMSYGNKVESTLWDTIIQHKELDFNKKGSTK